VSGFQLGLSLCEVGPGGLEFLFELGADGLEVCASSLEVCASSLELLFELRVTFSNNVYRGWFRFPLILDNVWNNHYYNDINYPQ